MRMQYRLFGDKDTAKQVALALGMKGEGYCEDCSGTAFFDVKARRAAFRRSGNTHGNVQQGSVDGAATCAPVV